MEHCEVRQGETLVGISLKYGVSVAALRRLNKLYGNEVYSGQILNLKSSSRSGKSIGTVQQQAFVQPPPPPTMEAITINPPIDKNELSNGIAYEKSNEISNTPTSGHLCEVRSRSSSKPMISITTPTILTPPTTNLIHKTISIISKSNTNNDGGEDGDITSEEEGGHHSKDKDPPHTPECMSSPILLNEGNILCIDYATKLPIYLPPRLQIENWILLHSVLNDGADLNSFFRKIKGRKYTVLIVETIKGEVFGGFNSVGAFLQTSVSLCTYMLTYSTC